MSLRSKLSRLSSVGPTLPAVHQVRPGAAPPCAPDEFEERARASRSEKLDELRSRIETILARRADPRPRPAVDVEPLPFVTESTPRGPRHTRALRIPASHRTGRVPVWPSKDASAELLALLALDPRLGACDPKRALYLDTETTGLSGGAGTVAFLVGVGSWTDEPHPAFEVEQLLVRNLGEEGPMLERVAERIAAASMLVTFNGKSFDMPLLRTRFVLAKMTPPIEPPHLDLLHVARRLHKARMLECRLASVEREVLGFERYDDVPSGEVSACYLHFLRTGDTRPMLAVVEHNTWDVVTMASLVGLYGEPLASTDLAPADLIGVAQTLRRAKEFDRAFDVATMAIDRGAGHESLRARAEIAKARGDRARALADFESLAGCIDDARVRLELAKLYEHYVKEPSRALEIVERGTSESEGSGAVRKSRLTRKVRKAEKTQDAPNAQQDESSPQGLLPGVRSAVVKRHG